MALSLLAKQPDAIRRGFTLIELLVVIAIIAILAAILFPVFAQARNKARQAACLSNLKQIGTAFVMYTQDYDETMPVWTTNACSTPAPASAFDFQSLYYFTVDPYIKNGAVRDSTTASTGTLRGVWACPSAKPQLTDSLSSVDTAFTTYAYNYYAMGGTSNCPTSASYPTGLGTAYAPFDGPEYGRPAPLAALKRPAETYVIMDGLQLCRPPAAFAPTGKDPRNAAMLGSHQSGSGTIAPAAGGYTPAISALNWKAYNNMLTGRLTNVVYADGHVKTLQTMNLASYECVMENGTWKGTAGSATTINTPSANAGWARDW